MFLEREYQNSVYNLDEADVAAQRQLYEVYKNEAQRLVAKKLPIPAYDHLLKLSASFNLLDARGAVSVTERADCFAAMRGLARSIASECLPPLACSLLICDGLLALAPVCPQSEMLCQIQHQHCQIWVSSCLVALRICKRHTGLNECNISHLAIRYRAYGSQFMSSTCHSRPGMSPPKVLKMQKHRPELPDDVCCEEMWVARREEQGFPMGICHTSPPGSLSLPALSPERPTRDVDDFVLELGCEELPAADLDSSIQQLLKSVPGAHAACKVW